jgi:hypothetical protein
VDVYVVQCLYHHLPLTLVRVIDTKQSQENMLGDYK